MTALLDVDQLRTFIAIAETGSFTRAADIVHKTQSAVSMQMKRLEERLDRAIFARDGRASKLTEDGERLLDYARRIVKLNVETIAAFSDELTGRVRLGVPDDYADRYLPEIMARFSRAYPGVELTVICEETICLLERIKTNEIDLAIITNCSGNMTAENFRQERLLWATSNRHSVHAEERVPLALGRPSCAWRRVATECLETVGRPYRVLYSSGNASAISAAVLSGLAVSVFPESGLRPGMRVLSAAGNITASFTPAAAASFFRLTSASDGTSTHTTAPPAFAISVLSNRAGSTPSASAACRPMRAAFGS